MVLFQDLCCSLTRNKIYRMLAFVFLTCSSNDKIDVSKDLGTLNKKQ